MRRRLLLVVPMLVCVTHWSGVAPAQAVPVQVLTRSALGGTDFIDWATLGPPFTVLGSSFVVTSGGGIAATVAQPGDGGFQRRDQPTSWAGNFAAGNALIWNTDASSTVSIVFSAPVSGAGAQLQRDSFGTFTATLTAFDASDVLLTTFSRTGESTSGGDNTAIFLGILSDLPNIGRITFVVADGFALNQVDLTTSAAPTPAPEPGTLLLLATALAGAVAAGRRGRS